MKLLAFSQLERGDIFSRVPGGPVYIKVGACTYRGVVTGRRYVCTQSTPVRV